MGIAEWALGAMVAIIVVFVIMRPDLWGKREVPRRDDGGAFHAADTRHRDDSDGDGGDD